jgi:hypothetical protein
MSWSFFGEKLLILYSPAMIRFGQVNYTTKQTGFRWTDIQMWEDARWEMGIFVLNLVLIYWKSYVKQSPGLAIFEILEFSANILRQSMLLCRHRLICIILSDCIHGVTRIGSN